MMQLPVSAQYAQKLGESMRRDPLALIAEAAQKMKVG